MSKQSNYISIASETLNNWMKHLVALEIFPSQHCPFLCPSKFLIHFLLPSKYGTPLLRANTLRIPYKQSYISLHLSLSFKESALQTSNA